MSSFDKCWWPSLDVHEEYFTLHIITVYTEAFSKIRELVSAVNIDPPRFKDFLYRRLWEMVC